VLRRERLCALGRHLALHLLVWYMSYASQARSCSEKVTRDQHGRGISRPRCRPRPGGVAPVVIALTAAVAFGAVDQYLPVAIPMSSHLGAYLFAVEVSQMSAPWLLLPFLAGAWQSDQRRAALTGLAATWLSVLAYVLMIVSPMEGAHLTPRTFAFSLASQWPWFAGGMITGPLYGWLGHRWRARPDPAAALLAALPILLEPVARWLATRLGLSSTGWLVFPWPLQRSGVAAEFAELAVGVLLAGVAIASSHVAGPLRGLKAGRSPSDAGREIPASRRGLQLCLRPFSRTGYATNAPS
jgi:Family of unknown function (DUF6518)